MFYFQPPALPDLLHKFVTLVLGTLIGVISRANRRLAAAIMFYRFRRHLPKVRVAVGPADHTNHLPKKNLQLNICVVK